MDSVRTEVAGPRHDCAPSRPGVRNAVDAPPPGRWLPRFARSMPTPTVTSLFSWGIRHLLCRCRPEGGSRGEGGNRLAPEGDGPMGPLAWCWANR